MKTVKIKEWDEMTEEYELDLDGNIQCKNGFTLDMKSFCGRTIRAHLKDDGEFYHSGWHFSSDMYTIVPDEHEVEGNIDPSKSEGSEAIEKLQTGIDDRKGDDENMLKTTIDGKLAVLSSDGFYYSVTNSGSMKREYTVFENISEPIKRERTSLKLGSILEYEGQIAFCSMVTENQYSLTKFQDKSVVNIQKGDELDDLGVAYKVIINPIQSILDADKSADATTLLSNNPNNAQKLSLTLQQQQNSSLGEIARALKGFKVE